MLPQVAPSVPDHSTESLTVDDEGAVRIPAPVRQAAGIEVGVPLAVCLEDGRITIETREQLAGRIRREVAAAWTGKGSAAHAAGLSLSERRCLALGTRLNLTTVTADTSWADLDLDLPIQVIR
jgi:bifunctional DNA-binding transcriptional regulator/antitoxin component of YhaV-PrlF toxin-antitoxin module